MENKTLIERVSNPGSMNYLKPKMHKRLPQIGSIDFLTETRLNLEDALTRQIHNNTGPYTAFVLRVDQNIVPPINTHYYGIYNTAQRKGIKFMRVYALVDIIHSHLPLPKDNNDHQAIQRFTAFYSEMSSGMKAPNVGGYCWVDFKDKQNWLDGIYVGCPDEGKGGSLGAEMPSLASSVFNTTNGFVNAMFPTGPAADGETVLAPKGYTQVKQVYGEFSYTEGEKGAVFVDPNWVRENIVNVSVINGQKDVNLHKAVAQEFSQLYEKAVTVSGYKPHIGSFVPRHIIWKAENPLSLHSWGIAVDFDSKKNKYKRTIGNPIRDYPSFVEVFERAGWVWGGRWSADYVDDMHFQKARV